MVAVYIHSNRMTFSAIMPLVTFISHKAMQCTTGYFPLLIYSHTPSFSLDVLFPLSSYTPEKLCSQNSPPFSRQLRMKLYLKRWSSNFTKLYGRLPCAALSRGHRSSDLRFTLFATEFHVPEEVF